MGSKKRGNIPPIVRDYCGYHITHTKTEKKVHTGAFSVYAGRNLKKDDFKTIDDAIQYIDNLTGKTPKSLDQKLKDLNDLIENADIV